MTKSLYHKPREASVVDHHVGEKLRLRRTQVGMSQTELGDMIGVTFQQVQKYERGTNRIGASRLWKLSHALDIPVQWFFEGMSALEANPQLSEEANAITKLIGSRDGIKFILALNKIEEGDIRRQLLGMVRAVAGMENDAEC